jgi:hypothetical protein
MKQTKYHKGIADKAHQRAFKPQSYLFYLGGAYTTTRKVPVQVVIAPIIGEVVNNIKRKICDSL